jgi:hypothetical protein
MKNFTITFSIFSVLYAIFYLILLFSNANIEYVDNILSINLRDIGNAIENIEDSKNHKLTYDNYMFNVQ